MLDYMVVILNYNSARDAIKAATSVNEHAVSDNYIICIADNASTNPEDKEILAANLLPRCHYVPIPSNLGYARGNNFAVRNALEYYDAEYFVIMNPDSHLTSKGTIEGVIQRVRELGPTVVGGQPFVWGYRYGESPTEQVHIRRVPEYLDLCIYSFRPLRFLLRKRFLRTTYLDQRPYRSEIAFHVPCGAFFVIDANYFIHINMFNEGTFLYAEEYFVGHRLRNDGKSFLFMPQFTVKHRGGGSTQESRVKKSYAAFRLSLESNLAYARTCLKVGRSCQYFLAVLSYIDHGITRISTYILRLFRCGSYTRKQGVD